MRIVKEKDKEKKRVYRIKTEKQKTTEMIIYSTILLLLLSYGFYVSFIRDNTTYVEDEEKTIQEVTVTEPIQEPLVEPTVIISDEPTEDKAMEDMVNHFLEDNDVSEKMDDFTNSFD